MSAASLAPRPAPEAGSSVSVFLQQRRLVRRYQEAVCAPSVDIEALMAELWGPNLTEGQRYGTDETDGFIDRIDEAGPELIRLMNAQQLQVAAAKLGTLPLPAFIRYLLGMEQRLTKPEHDPRLKLDDAGLAKAAGLGALTKAEYQKPHDPTAGPTARQLRRKKERENRALREAGLPIVVNRAPNRKAPAPMVVLVPLQQVFPEPIPAPKPRKWQPWHGQQLALWPDAAPGGLR